MGALVPTDPDPDRILAGAALVATVPPPLDGPRPEPRAAAAPLDELPRELSAYRLQGWLDVPDAAQVERLALVEKGKKRLIVKFYRPGTGPAPAVGVAWRSIEHPVVVPLHKFGEAGGRRYEVMDRVGDPLGGPDAPAEARRYTLRDLLTEQGGALPEPLVVDLVRQLAGALDACGHAKLAHLDVRPDNVLLTQMPEVDDAAPTWAATLVDFGSAVHLEFPEVNVEPRAATAYAARELVLVNKVTAASDWWSLGMLAAELSGGHPLLGADPALIREEALHPEPAPPELPARIRLLYDGLVTDERTRWDAAKVADWATGAPMDAPQDRATRPFAFLGEPYWELHGLVAAMQRNWADAVAVLFGPEADRLGELTDWLPQFDRVGRRTVELLDRLRGLAAEPDPWSDDARLLALLSWAGGSPAYRGLRADRDAIGYYARLALGVPPAPPADPTTADEMPTALADARYQDLVDDLWRWPLLRELDPLPGGRGLADVDRRWRELSEFWPRLAEAAAGPGGPLARHLSEVPEPRLRTQLLLLAVDEGYADELRRTVVAARAWSVEHLGRALPAYEELAAAVRAIPEPSARRRWLRSADPDAVRRARTAELVELLALGLLARPARNMVDDEQASREAAAVRDAALGRAWLRRERWRLLERPVALGWAAGAMGIVLVLWAVVLIGGRAVPPMVGLRPPTEVSVTVAWAFVLLCLAGQTACELWLAASIGAPYHRRYSLMTALLRIGALGQWFGRGYLRTALFLVAAAVAAAVLLAAIVQAPYALPVPVVVAHIWYARRRYGRWIDDHRELRERFAATPAEGSAR